MSPTRLSWEEYALKLAEVAALRSEDIRKVGCCILDESNRVLSLGYNGLAAGKEVNSEFWQNRDKRRPFMLHSEVNAFSYIKKSDNPKLLACTLLPCSSYAQMICSYGIEKVVYREDYEKDLKAKEIFEFYGVKLIQLK